MRGGTEFFRIVVYTKMVYTRNMRNVTFSADEELIEKARSRAESEQTTLNNAFREWLARYAEEPGAGERYLRLMDSLSHVRFDRKPTRDELNSR